MTDTTAAADTPPNTIIPITITATQLRKNPGQFLDRVFYRGESFIVETAGKPMAVIGPANLDTMMIYTELRAEDLAERMERMEYN